MTTTDQPSSLSLRALQFCRFMIFKSIRGGMPGFGQHRGPEVDEYLAAVGAEAPEDRSSAGVSWDWAGLFFAHKQAERAGEASNCPKVVSVLEAAELAPDACKLPRPRQGAVGILRQPDGTGRAVQCEVAFPDGSVATVEACSTGEESHAGDAWSRVLWNPADGKRGTVLCWLDFGIQAPPVATKPAPSSDGPPPPTSGVEPPPPDAVPETTPPVEASPAPEPEPAPTDAPAAPEPSTP